jgi:hypothetical protein
MISGPVLDVGNSPVQGHKSGFRALQAATSPAQSLGSSDRPAQPRTSALAHSGTATVVRLPVTSVRASLATRTRAPAITSGDGLPSNTAAVANTAASMSCSRRSCC